MHRLPKVLIGCGAVLALATAAWRPLVVPQVVKLPGSIDRTYQYQGTFATHVDPATGATLATPVTVPLSIERHITTVPDSTTAHVTLLHETVTISMAGKTTTQESVYALNRRTMQNVADPRAWTYTPTNVTDRSGTYYLTLPMGLNSSGEQLKMWKPEAGASYGIASATPGTAVVGGTSVVNLSGTIPAGLAAAPYEVAALKAQGFPTQLSAAQVATTLAAAGIDVKALTPALAGLLAPDELATVAKAIATPVPLSYARPEGRPSASPSAPSPPQVASCRSPASSTASRPSPT